ncbi:MAG: hypothetical protein V3U65_00230 [Granulosicoccaceae bacterium]
MPASIAATGAGTSIVNQATLVYIDANSGDQVEILSNTSSINVTALQSFELSSSQEIDAKAGDAVSFAHQLVNTGNVPDSYQVLLENSVDDASDLANLVLYIDENKNGVVDPNEQAAVEAFALEPNEIKYLVVAGNVSPSEFENAIIELLLSATSENDALPPITNVDTITIRADADLNIHLVSSKQCGDSHAIGERIELKLEVVNNIANLPEERLITVDGLDRSGVLIEYVLPEDAQLRRDEFIGIIGFQAIAVVKPKGHTDWMRYESWDGANEIDAIGMVVPKDAFTIDEAVQLNFELSYAITEQDKILSNASIDIDGDGVNEFESDAICHAPRQLGKADSPVIRFVEPTLALQQAQQAPDFYIDEQFIDANFYHLQNSSLDNASKGEVGYDAAVDGVYVELAATVPAEQILIDDFGVRYGVVRVSSAKTGDTLQLVLRETVPGAEVFRSIRPVIASPDVSADNGFCPGDNIALLLDLPEFSSQSAVCHILSDVGDELEVAYIDQITDENVSDLASVDPISTVFDSGSLAGVGGVTVTIVEAGAGLIGTKADARLTMVSNDVGVFYIPRLKQGQRYFFTVSPPAGYLFPSVVPPDKFQSYIVTDVSYGEDGFESGSGGFFTVSESDPLMRLDIPLDPSATDALLVVEKTALEERVEPGEEITYHLDIRNSSAGDYSDVTIVDALPFGFKYVPGSAFIDGEKLDDPERVKLSESTHLVEGNDRGMIFTVDTVVAGGSRLLQYRLLATAAALESNGLNAVSASATTLSGLTVVSSVSTAKVKIVQHGVLSDKAILFGKIYVDSSCDDIQNNGEWPIGGVRLYMQDGTYVITDEDGQYSLFGLDPGFNVIKVDNETLPEGLTLKPLDSRHGADPDSRFVELSVGDFHRADFAAHCPMENSVAIFEKIKRRNKSIVTPWILDSDSSDTSNEKWFNGDDDERAIANGDVSNGRLGVRRKVLDDDNGTLEDDQKAPDKGGGVKIANSSASKQPKTVMGDPKKLAPVITAEQAKAGTWLWPENDISNDGRFMAVVRAGLEPQLNVNGVAVAGTQIGERIVNTREAAQIVAWYGVKLSPGVNQLSITGLDSFGNSRVLAEKSVKRPTAGVRMVMRTRDESIAADGGRSQLPIDLLILDGNGYPASGVYFVTVESSRGRFAEEDLQENEPGLQIRIEGGRGKVHLQSTDESGKVFVRAKTGSLSAQLRIVQLAEARPLIGSGLVSIEGSWHKDRFSEETFETAARVALFLKGKIRNQLKLTLAYDSKRKEDNSLLRDVDPSEYYATYGDASVRGYEAQSRSKLYAKIEKDRHSVMWGDYITDNYKDNDDLARVQRTFTGLNAVFDNAKTRVQVFAAEQSTNREFEEIRGNGTAMLYQIANAPVVRNSEIVELIVRDRDNPGAVIETTNLLRYRDYILDDLTGLIRFTDAIPSLDDNLNPVFIRITYETQSANKDYLVAGLRVQHNFSEEAHIGFSLTEDQNPLSGSVLSGIYAAYGINANTEISAAVAHQQHTVTGRQGKAGRVRLEHNWGRSRNMRTAMSWARSTKFFDNPGAGLSADRLEWRIDHRQPVSNTITATAEAVHSESVTEDQSQSHVGMTFERTLRDWTLTLGGKHYRIRERGDSDEFNTMLLGAERRFELGNGKRASIGVDYEWDLQRSNRHRLGLVGRVQVHKSVDVYARFEKERALRSPAISAAGAASTQFTLGVESTVLPNTRMYSEYRMRSNFGAEEFETASGIKGRYELVKGLSISPGVEVIDALDGQQVEDAIALSLGVTDKRNLNRKITAQAEIRETDSNRYYGFRGSMAQRFNVDWTGLVREEFTRQLPVLGEMTSRHRLTLGFARRPKLENKHHQLYLAKWLEDYGPADGADKKRYLLSTHQNLQLKKNVTLSGRFGAKWQRAQFSTGNSHTKFMLADARLTIDLYRRLELDLQAGWLGVGGGGGNRYSLGARLAWLINRNVRLGVGYNVVGFREEDLDENGYNEKGLQLGLQLKFDEDWFRWLE